LRLLRLAALDRLVVANAARIARWLDEVHESYGYDDYRALLEYVWSAGKEEGMIEAIIEHSHEDTKDSAMSAADWLRAQGWRQGWEDGRAAGREEGLRALLLRQLELRFGSVSPQVKAKVLEADPTRVETWALRLLSATTLDEAISDPQEPGP
jgi:hypothetical protein